MLPPMKPIATTLASYLHRRMIDLYLDDVLRAAARVELRRLARERGVDAADVERLIDDALDRWPAQAA